MAKVSSYTPPWLSRTTAGFDLFKSPPASQGTPLRTIAARGTEIFLAAGNEIRWTDLGTLKENGQTLHETFDRSSRSPSDADEPQERSTHRTLKTPARNIKELHMSPNGLYIAIVSSHTVHVAVLPDPSFLSSDDTAPLKLKTYQIGPTSHVLERAPVASTLWHPLGVNGDCLVTVTADSVVRFWELDRNNRWTFDQPALAVDLKKLANGFSAGEDFSPSKYGTSKGFSPDSFEMEVASACFGASGPKDEGSWATMTLWIAMREGDLYALCPLLPSHFQDHTSSLRQLVSAQKLDLAAFDGYEEVPEWANKILKQQHSWLSAIEAQLEDEDFSSSTMPTQTLRRPSNPSPVPKLQGPFQLSPDPDVIFDITDMCTLSAAGDQDEELEDSSQDGVCSPNVALDMLCLATSDGKAHVCVSLNKIEPRWLPVARTQHVPLSTPDVDNRELLVVESLSLVDSDEPSWPLFTEDVTSPSKVFITFASGVVQLDLAPFKDRLNEELAGEGDTGVEFRVSMVVENAHTTCTQLMRFEDVSAETSRPNTIACINLLDPELGHFVLTATADHPHAVTLDTTPSKRSLLEDAEPYDDDLDIDLQALSLAPERSAYDPPSTFWEQNNLPTFLDTHVHSRNRRALHDEVRLSPATLDLLMSTHRTLSTETHRLGLAAADLFSRCERLQDEFRAQVQGAKDVVARIASVTGQNDGAYENGTDGEEQGESVKERVESRLDNARIRQEAMVQRYDELRQKISKVSRRPFGEKERDWQKEVEHFGSLVLRPEEEGVEQDGEQGDAETANSEETSGTIVTWRRLDEAGSLQQQLLEQFNEYADQHRDKVMDSESGERDVAAFNVALERRKARSVEIEELLERQAALVDATKDKLAKLMKISVD